MRRWRYITLHEDGCMKTIIIDYGAGNLASVFKALKHAAPDGMDVAISDKVAEIAKASHVFLPGVGAFGDCRKGLEENLNTLSAMQSHVEAGKPFMGICVGMQLLAERGYEHGVHTGLGWLPGTEIRPIEAVAPEMKIPHMGWNTLHFTDAAKGHPVLASLEEGNHAYFVHSYHMVEPPETTVIAPWKLATTDYYTPITAIVGQDNIIGTQFHPEKSQKTGLTLLGNFLRWQP